MLATTATDGHVAFFKIPLTVHETSNSWEYCAKVQIHQSGVKSMEVIEVDGNQTIYLV